MVVIYTLIHCVMYFMFVEAVQCPFCINGATCEETEISATCHCADGYFGDGCGEKIYMVGKNFKHLMLKHVYL